MLHPCAHPLTPQPLPTHTSPLPRFINEEVFKTEVRQGRPTPPGAPLDVPYAQPLAAYLILAAQVVVYALGTSLAISKVRPSAW